jgi:hypothetical protein
MAKRGKTTTFDVPVNGNKKDRLPFSVPSTDFTNYNEMVVEYLVKSAIMAISRRLAQRTANQLEPAILVNTGMLKRIAKKESNKEKQLKILANRLEEYNEIQTEQGKPTIPLVLERPTALVITIEEIETEVYRMMIQETQGKPPVSPDDAEDNEDNEDNEDTEDNPTDETE